MKPKAVILTFVLAVVSPVAYAQTNVRQVDFLNFTYSLPWCSNTFKGDIPSRVNVKNGHFKRGDSYVSVDRKNILYADLTGDGAEEAVVPVLCGPLHANYAGSDEVLIFTLRNGTAVLLAELDEDVFQRDYERYYKSAYLSAESGVRVDSTKLVIDKTSGECHACSDTYRTIALQYQWNGKGFALVGKPAMTKSK